MSHAAKAGSDTVTATLAGTGGWFQANLTLAEFSTPLTTAGSAAAWSSGTAHSSGAISGSGASVVVGAYGDAGFATAVTMADGRSQFGQNASPTVQTESDQSWGTTSVPAVFNSAAATNAEVVAAAFQTI